MKKTVCGQIKDHLNSNDLQEPFQSAYRELHSTETALLRVRTDILRCIDDGKAVGVVLLDLSAAFDTVFFSFKPRKVWHTPLFHLLSYINLIHVTIFTLLIHDI